MRLRKLVRRVREESREPLSMIQFALDELRTLEIEDAEVREKVGVLACGFIQDLETAAAGLYRFTSQVVAAKEHPSEYKAVVEAEKAFEAVEEEIGVTADFMLEVEDGPEFQC